MNNVVLIRHGEVEYPTNSENQKLIYDPNVNLSREGNLQANALARESSSTYSKSAPS